MLKTFPIDFIRQAFEQKLLQEHIKNTHLYGGKNQVNIFSFYEQLKSQEQVDRYVETWRDLSDQQNRAGLLLNGVLISPENPTITNLYSSTIIPMTWTCSLRCRLEDRDNGIITINNLIKELKGRKVDIAQLNCVDDYGKEYCEPFMVGTIGQGDGEPTLKNGDYIGNASSSYDISTLIHNLIDNNVVVEYDNVEYLYCNRTVTNQIKVIYINQLEFSDISYDYESVYIEGDRRIFITGTYSGKLYREDIKTNTAKLIIQGTEDVEMNITMSIDDFGYNEQTNQTTIKLGVRLGRDIDEYVDNYSGFYLEDVTTFIYIYDFVEDDGTYSDVIFPPQHQGFEKYKVSFSFDAIRCDEPRNLNEKEYCELSFGGSATLVNESVKLGNDLLKISVHKNKIVADSNIDLSSSDTYYLEPLEMPSGSNANTQLNQLMSNKFVANTHTDSLSLTLQYSFIATYDILILKQWFDYARYGIQDTTSATINDRISPNIIYDTNEYWCSWGNFENKQILTKIVNDIGIENTESDTLTISVTFQIQGENN